MKQPLLIQDEKRSWGLSILVAMLFAFAMLGCFVARNNHYETPHEIAIGRWATPTLRVTVEGQQPPQTWPILRVERAHLDPFDLWGRMGQDILLTPKDEEKSRQAENDWLTMVKAGLKDDRAPKYREYQFAMMWCAVEEMNHDATILGEFEDLVYNRGWGGQFPTREVYRAIMMQILDYLEKADVWVQENPGKKFSGTARIPVPDNWKKAAPPPRPAACTDDVERDAKKCMANKDKGVSASPAYTSGKCKRAIAACELENHLN